MSFLKRLDELEFPVTWTFLLVGWNGPVKNSRLVTVDDIIDHATHRIDSSKGGDHPEIIKLAAAQRHETDEIESYLKKLSVLEKGDPDIEARRWRYLLLEDLMDRLPSDPVQGLVALTTFWEQFDFPTGGPHQVQGKDNEISPNDYYTIPFFEETLHKHKSWMEKERQLLNEDVDSTRYP